MGKHTPGPWHTGPLTAAGYVWVYKDFSPLAEPANFWDRLRHTGRVLLFRLRGDGAWKLYNESKEQHEERYWQTVEANAQLMATAPELLDAIEGALRIADLWAPPEAIEPEHENEYVALQMMLDNFKAVVAKAKGTP